MTGARVTGARDIVTRRCLLLAAVLVAGGGVGCRSRVQHGLASPGIRYGGVGAPAPLGWSRVTPTGAGFACDLPGDTRLARDQERDEDGSMRTTLTATSESSLGFFMVSVAQWEGGLVGDPLRAAGEAARAGFERAELEREASRRLAVDGFFAREDTGRGQGGAFVVLRQYVGADRIVVALAVVPRTQDGLGGANRFVSSIALDPAHALVPAGGTHAAGGAWFPVYMPETEFAIEMPSAPTVREQEVTLVDRARPVATFETRDAWGRYRVRVIGFGDDVPAGAFAGVVERLGLEREVRPVQASGFPGRVYLRDEGAERTWARVYQTAGRIYVVEAIGARASIRERGVQRALLRYFDSFRIL